MEIDGKEITTISCGTSTGALTLDAIVAQLERAKEGGRRPVLFTGGDVTERADAAALLRAVAERGLRFGLQTHGRKLASRRTVDNLMRLGLVYAEVTLAAGMSYPYFLATGVQGFRDTLDGIANLVRAGLRVTVTLPVDRFSHGSLNAAMIELESMPGEVVIDFVPSRPDVYDAEIDAARRFLQKLRGERADAIQTGLVLRPSGELLELDLAACPYKQGATLDDAPLYAALIRRGPKRYERFTLDRELDAHDVFLTKNIRSLIWLAEAKTAARLRLHETCANCRHLHACHGAFVPEGDAEAAAYLQTEIDAAPDIDITAERPDTAYWVAAIRRRMERLAAGQTLSIRGELPAILAGAELPKPSAIADIDAGFIADLAAIYGLETVDYCLPPNAPGPHWQVVLRKPERRTRGGERIAVFNMSSACVANCIMCNMPRIYGGRAIPTAQIVPALEELKLCGFNAVDSFGGEITLREDLFALLRSMKALNLYAMLITTGYQVHGDYLAGLADAGLDKITVALDSTVADMHDTIKGRDGLQAHALRALKEAGAHPKLYVEVNTVILEQNIGGLPELHRFVAQELGVRIHRMFYYTHSPNALIQPRWLNHDKARRFFGEIRPQLLHLQREFGTQIDFCPPIEPPEHDDELESFYERVSSGRYHEPTLCRAPDHELSITPEGELYPCVSPTVVHRAPPLGTLGATRIIDGLNSAAIAVWKREAGSWPECANCISKRS